MPSMEDPLGRPTVVTSADYMDALGRLGYNVETMSSSLPMYTKAAQAATSFMDQAFNQRMAWEKAQADNKEAIARANQADSLANYNNQTLDLKKKQLDQENQQRDLELEYNRHTLAGREQGFDLQRQIQQQNFDIDNATFEGRKALAIEQGKAQLADTQQKSQDLQSALADRQPAINELYQIPKDATDFDQQFESWHRRHLNTITNPATKEQIAGEIQSVMDKRGQLIGVQKMAANRTELSRLAAGNHLPANMDLDSPAFINDKQKVQQALVQGHVSEEVDNLNGLYTRITGAGIPLPPQQQREWEDLRGVRDRLTKTQNLDGYMDIVNGGNGNGDILNPDGHLRKDVQVMVQDIQAFLDRQAALKPPEAQIVTGKPGTVAPEVTIKNVPAGQVQQYTQGAAGAQQQQEALRLATPEFVNAHPEIRPFVSAYNQDRSDENKAKLAEAIIKAARGYQYGGRVGYQTGGQVAGAGSAGDTTPGQYIQPGTTDFLGTTDTVPAMLTPGEFVLNKNAVQALGPQNLAAVNRIGAQTSPTLTPIAGSPLPADTDVAAFAGLSQQQRNPDAIPQTPIAVTPESDTASVNQPPAVQKAISNAGRLPTSNVNNYAYPEGAPDLNGIDRNVWANVMGEEGPEFGMDGKHMSVFGLWKDAPGLEGQAFSTIKQYGANSLPAYNAVTNAWDKLFLGKTQPQKLTSPGMQEMVIADSQHAGGAPTLKLIQQMGGWDAINKMNPADAIRTYSALRTNLWPGNQARVNRELQWALANDGTLSGQGGTQVAGMQSGGMVNPAYNPQAPVQAGQQPIMDPSQMTYDPSMIIPAPPQPELTTGQPFPPPNRPVWMQDGGYVPQPGLNFQRGGEVGGGGFESELEGGGGRGAGGAGGFEAGLDQPGAGAGQGPRHRRFHPRTAGMGGMGAQPNIPDPMQRKLHKLSQDFVTGLSSMIRSRPELGGAIMQHAKNLMASTGLGDVRTGGEGGLDFLGGGTERQQQPMINPAMLAMSGMGGGEGSSSEESYT